MIDYQHFFASIEEGDLAPWYHSLPALFEKGLSATRHGDLPRWQAVLDSLPDIKSEDLDIKTTVRIGRPDEISDQQSSELALKLQQFHPWRKGPFTLFGVDLDTEWRSDWKWQRLVNHISPLAGRRVLDVGCGSGYHCWRMAGEGAEQVIGIDPSPLFVMQFRVIKQLMAVPPKVDVLPLRLEELPELLPVFDTVFSMGVLYHRRSPLDHLKELRRCLKPGGELVLETLVVEGELGEVLMPEGRYAKMGNVWFIPSPATLALWLRRIGFKEIRVVDLNQTSVHEQRTTEWMRFESLVDFLDPNDHNLTIEGYPAPKRVVIVARNP
ncbi:MAG: tRNA 5-methoxyuridine(34)/uridine 5-oxyacetic acid(34) synthase CmoB [Gammaproteobacteria bacterium]|nr:tRNA 5-methoxyuridine(34)/uridine 5-oxyacetic acid(34) synthase CmoB [Gammaproteobacteria bacterium]MCF6230862.1 tRNA 5-methoxyuridine(34)/uridine 5-oxyacetic acid(34) synthase CmoB [Gammaproteobacteria bacterium]